MRKRTRYLFFGRLVLTLAIAHTICQPECHAEDDAQSNILGGTNYDDDPEYLWNRLHNTLIAPLTSHRQASARADQHPLVRTDGGSKGRPIYVAGSAVLKEFNDKQGESLVDEPLPRALLQHDLWRVFDQLAVLFRSSHRTTYLRSKPGMEQFRDRLAAAIKRLALSADDIGNLSDNYALALRSEKFAATFDKVDDAYLPADLFTTDGPWVEFQKWRGEPVAPFHLERQENLGRAATRLFLKLPAGRAATVDYLKRLREFPKPYVPNSTRLAQRVGNERWDSDQHGMWPALMPNHKTPQFPVGTAAALIQQKLLIDNIGRIRASGLTELVEVRVYRKIGPVPKDTHRLNHSAIESDSQAGYRFHLDIAMLLRGEHGGLVPERVATIKEAQAKEAGDRAALPRANSNLMRAHQCISCHNPPGVFSLRSQFPFERVDILRHALYPVLTKHSEAYRTADWKRRRFEWGLLTGAMRSE
jgi:hypothetical protein